ncbi:MAG: hypothetical protein HXX11_23115, partial [Desulfuromonadales bacterium]|nr:hypothetical protein [Desulfuromonadales bacterium]
ALCLLVAQSAFALMGDFSVGYRMGNLTKLSTKGIIKSGEGQLLLGNESSPYTNKAGKAINPWYFSASKKDVNEFQALTGEYVVVEYEQARVKNPMKDTDYTAKKIYPVTRTLPSPQVCQSSKVSGMKSDGVRAGRIVKASLKGNVINTWEIEVQMGDGGNQFKNMSVSEKHMFDCAVAYLKSGKKAKIYYKESFIKNPLEQNTNYDVYKIEPVGAGLN